MITIIIPTYNDEDTIKRLLDSLYDPAVNLADNNRYEVIIADGGSDDRTVEIAKRYPVRVIKSIRKRALQMNAGAKIAESDALLFLHADCLLGKRSLTAIENCLSKGYVGGCLSQRIISDKFISRFIEASGNIRAKFFKIFYGDQAIFVRRAVFFELGGFDNIELLDDVIFSRRLKKMGKVCVLPQKVYVSARRWQKQGFIRTTLANWVITLGFLFGISPNRLKRIYHDIR